MKQKFSITIEGEYDTISGVASHSYKIESHGVPMFAIVGLVEMVKVALVDESVTRAKEKIKEQ